MRTPVLISGIPRSGSTWLGKVLSKAPYASYLHEPDNEKAYVKTIFDKEGIHRYPYIRVNQESAQYFKLWESVLTDKAFNHHQSSRIFNNRMPVNPFYIEQEIGRKSGLIHDDFFIHTEEQFKGKIMETNAQPQFSHLDKETLPIVKSVHNLLSLDWITENFNTKTVVIVRHPANVIASYLKLRMPDAIRNIFAQPHIVEDFFNPFYSFIQNEENPIKQMSYQIGAFYYVLEKYMERNPDWVVIRHEDICSDPLNQFEKLFGRLGLDWTDDVVHYIEQSNKQGEGFHTKRVASDQIEKYKKMLTKEVIDEILRSYSIFNNKLYG